MNIILINVFKYIYINIPIIKIYRNMNNIGVTKIYDKSIFLIIIPR